MFAHRLADGDAAGFGELLQSCRDVDAVAEDVVFFDDDVAEIDSDAELDLPWIDIGIALAIRRWISARMAASMTLANSTSMPSPVVLMIRPLFLTIAGSMSSSRWVLSRANVPASSISMSRL